MNPGSNLFVTGIHPKLTEPEISRLFEKYGEVEKAQIMRDPHTKESRGFGFVKMALSEQADAAKEGLQGEQFEGRTLSIEKARRARPRTPTPGKYFGPPKRGMSLFALRSHVNADSHSLLQTPVADSTIASMTAAVAAVTVDTGMIPTATVEAMTAATTVVMTVDTARTVADMIAATTGAMNGRDIATSGLTIVATGMRDMGAWTGTVAERIAIAMGPAVMSAVDRATTVATVMIDPPIERVAVRVTPLLPHPLAIPSRLLVATPGTTRRLRIIHPSGSGKCF